VLRPAGGHPPVPGCFPFLPVAWEETPSEIMAVTRTLNCPVCSAPSAVEHVDKDFSLCRCSECDHCFTDLNSLNHLEVYEAPYFQEEHRNWFLHPNLSLYRKLRQVILGHNRRASVLDVGCGNGNFLRYLASKGDDLSLTGIDIAPNQPSFNIKYLLGNFLCEKVDEKFDVLVSLSVIEHVPEVTAFATRLDELCQPGGLVIIQTIDERSVIYRASRILERAGWSVPLKRLYSKHHLNHFTDSSLKYLLKRQGLAIVQVFRHNSPMAAVDIPPTSPLGAVILRAGIWVAFQLGQLTRRTMYQTIVARKPD